MTRVLVVDDSLTVRMDLEEAFEAGGFAPTLCASLDEARRALAAGGFALVVLDVLLPDGDGLDLLGEIRRAPARAATPVVLLSTEAEVRHRLRGLAGGADAYVGKPYDAAAVVARARELVRRRAPGALRAPVLVVDDSVTVREELRAELEAAGHAVVTAASGEEGLRVAAGSRPAAVVVDGRMEGMDGAAFVRELRADPALRATPCILLTASGAVNELGALAAGADAYVLKDEGNAVVLARLEALLRGAPAERPGEPAALLSPKRLVAIGGDAALRPVADRLREDGDDVVIAATAGEALALLAVEPADGVLVDGAAGFAGALDACHRLRADPHAADLPLFVLAGGDDPERVLEAIRAGADDALSTGAGVEVVRARVRARLRRKQLDEDARQRDQWARSASILETIADAFFAVDRGWELVYVNRPFEALVGARREALAGKVLWDCCPWAGAPEAAAALRRAVAERAPATFEAAAPPDRWLEVRAFPHGAGLSAYVRDVTERRRSEEVQGHIFGIVGHDLRTPLTALTTSASMMLRDPALSEKSRRAAQRISGSATRMARLIADLLDYSRARLGRPLPVNVQPAHFGAICEEVIEEVRAATPGRAIAYRHEGDGLGAWDRGRVQQVLVNLLTNALRHGAEDGTVTLAWTGTPEEKVVTVHNDGPAIPPWLRPQLFEPFKRGGPEGAAWGGVGLGLYIVRQIVLAHGGAVAVFSEEGQGTTVEVRLPSQPAGRPRAGLEPDPDLEEDQSGVANAAPIVKSGAFER